MTVKVERIGCFPNGDKCSDLHDIAEDLRAVADLIENGKSTAGLWITFNKEKMWKASFFNGKSVTIVELQGALFQMLHEISQKEMP